MLFCWPQEKTKHQKLNIELGDGFKVKQMPSMSELQFDPCQHMIPRTSLVTIGQHL